MVVVEILGGLASQISKFMYAYAIAKDKDTELWISVHDYLNGYFRPFLLHYLDIPNCKVVDGIKGIPKIQTIRNDEELIKCYEKKKFPNIYLNMEQVSYKKFFEKYPKYEDSNLLYLINKVKIKKESEFVENFRNKVRGEYSVGVHVRRGDFVKLGWQDDTKEYKSIIGKVFKEHPEAQFYFFSNDIEWTRKQYGNYECFHYVENHNGDIGDIEDLFCMAECNLRILSSMSGYGLYANLLSTKNDKSDGAYVVKEIRINDEFIKRLNQEEAEESYLYYNRLIQNEVNADNKVYYCNPLLRRDIVRREVNRINKQQRENFWKSYYGIASEIYHGRVVLVTNERHDRWRWNGWYLYAVLLARLGISVLYINTNKRSSFAEDTSERFADAVDMDGVDLDFSVMYLPFKEIPKLDECLMGWLSGENEYKIYSQFPIEIKEDYCLAKINISFEWLKYQFVDYILNFDLRKYAGNKIDLKFHRNSYVDKMIVDLNEFEIENSFERNYIKSLLQVIY